MKNLLVSIIVPVFNAGIFLPKSINSILMQTYSNIEIILVNDGSTDHSGMICDKYKEQDKRVKVIHKKNGGASSARKIGIDNMHGDYGLFVDSDDWLDENAVEKCVAIVQQYRNECVIFSYVREYKNQSLPVQMLPISNFFSGDETKEIYRRIWGLYGTEMKHPEKGDSLSPCWGKLFSAKLLRKAIFVDTKLVGCSEDTLFNIYALRGCDSVYFLNEPLYHYRKQENGTISSSYRPKLIEQYKVLYDFFDKAKEELQIDEECQQAYINRTALSIIGVGINELDNPKLYDRVNKIREYINNDRNSKAYKRMQKKYMPLIWKFFFFSVQNRMTLLVYLQLKAMRFLKSRI